jgi:hypothetical protein
MGSVTRVGARHRSDRVGTTTVPTPVNDCSKAPLRHSTSIRSFSPLLSRHSRAIKFAAIRTVILDDQATNMIVAGISVTSLKPAFEYPPESTVEWSHAMTHTSTDKGRSRLDSTVVLPATRRSVVARQLAHRRFSGTLRASSLSVTSHAPFV